jgi:mono/diheme cytochrome c family protein
MSTPALAHASSAFAWVGVAAVLLTASVACDHDPNMRDQPRDDIYEPSPLFTDGGSARPLPPGTIPRTPTPRDDDAAGLVAPQPPTTAALLTRGQERFNIYCSMCHGRDGYGEGMIVQRGYPAPGSFHTDILRAMPDQHYYNVITGGLGKMQPYAQLVPPPDRWAIIAYIRALQLSQHAPAELLPPEERSQIQPAPPLPPPPMRQP